MTQEDEKKERVIHTRVPQSLDDEIRQHAARLGVSVSNLVRNVLQNAVGLVGDIVADTASIAQSVSIEPAWPPASDRPVVLGWQKVLLSVNAVCDRCNEILPRGTEAALAMVEGKARRIMRCLACLEAEVNDKDA